MGNNAQGRKVAEEISKEYNLKERIQLINSGKMDDVIAEKVAQKVKKGDLITKPTDSRKYDDRSPSQKFSDEIKEKYHRMQNERNSRVQSKDKSSKSQGSGAGKWVTINGAHVYLD